MKNILAPDTVLTAATTTRVTFNSLPTDPILAGDLDAMSSRTKAEIVDRYKRHGFAIVHLDPDDVAPGGVSSLAKALGLGEPFVPPLYQRGGYTSQAISRLSAHGTVDKLHPSFERAGEVKLHCDGTLQPIGYVKTSILLCERPAPKGGETILFNASAAYAQLATADRPAAAALAHPGVLVRQANINGVSDSNAGPAFASLDGELVCCYSVSNTDRWETPPEVAGADLTRGVAFFSRAAMAGSPYFAEFQLRSGDAIILSNAKISHGRRSYADSQSHCRCLYRGLFLNEPSAGFVEIPSPQVKGMGR